MVAERSELLSLNQVARTVIATGENGLFFLDSLPTKDEFDVFTQKLCKAFAPEKITIEIYDPEAGELAFWCVEVILGHLELQYEHGYQV
jgi:hypothetical protein